MGQRFVIKPQIKGCGFRGRRSLQWCRSWDLACVCSQTSPDIHRGDGGAGSCVAYIRCLPHRPHDALSPPWLCGEDPTPRSPKTSSKEWGQARGRWGRTGSGTELKPSGCAWFRQLPPGLAVPGWARGCHQAGQHRHHLRAVCAGAASCRARAEVAAKEGTERPRCCGAMGQPAAHQELELCAREEATNPPVLQTLTCGSVPTWASS